MRKALPLGFTNFLLTLFSITLGLICCLAIVALIGENPLRVLEILFTGAFGSVTNIGYTLFYATPLIFTGLSVAVAFHCGLFNIGAEGQLYIGALLLTTVGILVPDYPVISPFLGICVAFLGGALWGGLAGWLKAYRGSHEVIVTIMLNFISYSICGFAIMNLFKNTETQNPESKEVGVNYLIGGLGDISQVSPVNSAFFLALLVAFAVWIILFKTKWGFELRLSGSAPETAMRAGINVKRRVLEAMFISGGLAGLVAVNEILGFAHKFKDQFSIGYGFTGIAVALLGRNRPLGIVAAALLFGAIQKGSLELEIDTEKITRDLSGVMLAFIILFVASESFWRSKIKFLRKREQI
ncbi:MAG: ABC transporter permease [Oligoflexia bacterium]|nr:ABC transporter permease [Oligoflexia bacterium]